MPHSKTAKIISEALSWLNTPYQHQVGLRGVGVDCAYLVGKVALDAGLIKEFKPAPYSIEWHVHNNTEELLNIIESFGCTKIENVEPGSILCFKYGRVCSHLGIAVTKDKFIHAHLPSGKVLINTLSGDFKERLKSIYRFPE